MSTTGTGTARSRGFAAVAALLPASGSSRLIGARVREKLTASARRRPPSWPSRSRTRPSAPASPSCTGWRRPGGPASPSPAPWIRWRRRRSASRPAASSSPCGSRSATGSRPGSSSPRSTSPRPARRPPPRARACAPPPSPTTWPRTPRSARLALFEQKAVSDAENLGAQNRAALALAQLEQASAQAQLAPRACGTAAWPRPSPAWSRARRTASARSSAPGEALFHIEDTSVLKLVATLSEADARLVEVGSVVTVEGGRQGKVTAVLPSLDPQTRRVPVHAEIPNDPASAGYDGGRPPMPPGPAGPSSTTASTPLLAGAFVRAAVLGHRHKVRLELPPGALRPGSQDEVVVLTGGKAHISPRRLHPGRGRRAPGPQRRHGRRCRRPQSERRGPRGRAPRVTRRAPRHPPEAPAH